MLHLNIAEKYSNIKIQLKEKYQYDRNGYTLIIFISIIMSDNAHISENTINEIGKL